MICIICIYVYIYISLRIDFSFDLAGAVYEGEWSFAERLALQSSLSKDVDPNNPLWDQLEIYINMNK